jgi:small conductance mechanosensitive channel
MTGPPLAADKLLPFVSNQDLGYFGIGLVVLLIFVAGSRFVSNRVVASLRRRNMRSDVVQIGGRVVTVVLIGLGIWFGIGFAFQSQNFTLAGILLATIVASFGVQDLLKDYVSGYYILLERHIRVGDRITMEGVGSGTVTEIKLRVTLLKTDSGDLLVMPNSELFNKSVTVHVRADKRVAETKAEAEGSKTTPPE